MEVMVARGKKVVILDIKKTETQECRLNRILDYHFVKLICKTIVSALFCNLRRTSMAPY